MQLPFKGFQQLVQDASASVQGAARQALDLTVGSILRATIEAVAGTALWLQYIALLVMKQTRAATSNGADLDSFYADFLFTRLPAVAATGLVALSRITATQPALIVPGVTLRTLDGTQTFVVTTDTTNSFWSASLGAAPGYYLPAGVVSAAVPVAAATPGAGGNIQAGTLALLGSAIPGIDTAANAAAFTNGINAETDAAFRARFVSYIASRARGTPAAVQYAAASIQQGVTTQVSETAGAFVLYVDDGSGYPPTSLITAVSANLLNYRALGVQFAVQPPTVIGAAINMLLVLQPGTTRASVVGKVATAVTAYVNALPIGVPLNFFAVASVATGVDSSIIGLESVTLNGAASDIGGGVGQVVKVASCTIT